MIHTEMFFLAITTLVYSAMAALCFYFFNKRQNDVYTNAMLLLSGLAWAWLCILEVIVLCVMVF